MWRMQQLASSFRHKMHYSRCPQSLNLLLANCISQLSVMPNWWVIHFPHGSHTEGLGVLWKTAAINWTRFCSLFTLSLYKLFISFAALRSARMTEIRCSLTFSKWSKGGDTGWIHSCLVLKWGPQYLSFILTNPLSVISLYLTAVFKSLPSNETSSSLFVVSSSVLSLTANAHWTCSPIKSSCAYNYSACLKEQLSRELDCVYLPWLFCNYIQETGCSFCGCSSHSLLLETGPGIRHTETRTVWLFGKI